VAAGEDVVPDSELTAAIYRVMAIVACGRRSAGRLGMKGCHGYRIMENNLLLLHYKPQRPQGEHNGQVAVQESDQR